MRKLGKIKVYNNWTGVISSGNLRYRFRKDDIKGTVDIKVGDIVTFVPEKYPYTLMSDYELVARFVKKKELSK